MTKVAGPNEPLSETVCRVSDAIKATDINAMQDIYH